MRPHVKFTTMSLTTRVFNSLEKEYKINCVDILQSFIYVFGYAICFAKHWHII